MVFPYCRQRFSYEQYGGKLAFAFRHAHSKIFLFCFFFSLFKAKPQRFCGHHKNTQTIRLSPKPVLFIGCVGSSYYRPSVFISSVFNKRIFIIFLFKYETLDKIITPV